MLLPHFLARLLIGIWLRTSPDSWMRRVIARDSPHVHAPGTNPDRVLLVGDGVATGRGVLTHELGLAGYLARSLSALTGHATDVDIAVHQSMTVRSCLAALEEQNLSRFDTVVLSIGHNEALSLMNPRMWRDGLDDVLDDLERTAPSTMPVSILAIPVFGPRTALPAYLSRVVDRHAERLNALTERIIADRPNATLIAATASNQFEPETRHVYRRWADNVAVFIAAALDSDRVPAGDTSSRDEMKRQLALEELEASSLGAEDALDDLVESARHIFGTPVAAVTLIHSDYLSMRAAAGMESGRLPREEAFCDVTIRRAAHLVIEDARADDRYAHYSIVAGSPEIRFYAGYPIESPDGHRVGAFCVMDTETRSFTHDDLGLLRSLALTAQQRLWPHPSDARSGVTGRGGPSAAGAPEG